MTSPHRTRTAGRTAACAVVAGLCLFPLASCGLLGGDRGEDDDKGDRGGRDSSSWAYDEDSARYYRPELVTQSTDLVSTHFPGLDDVQRVTITDGQFTDPDGRELLPAPDDYWWQGVVELPAEQVDSLVEEARQLEASDGGGQNEPDTVSDDELLDVIVPTLEPELTPCPGGWIPLAGVEALTQGANISHGGDLLEIVVVCEGGTQLVTSARDM
ncbi:hypothetical protein ACTXO9_08050 [Brachybacterium tyrofermentans]|uniref:hypothetical protein n=1 Tax=Brachybacterium tyrofermentans TaxID=47848 RepID=UPI003FD693BC